MNLRTEICLDTTTTYSQIQFEDNIKCIREKVINGTLANTNDDTLYDILSIIIIYNNISNTNRYMYNELFNFLEIYENMYNEKQVNLINSILNNMVEQDKRILPVDSNGNHMLIAKPILERSSRIIRNNEIQLNIIYKRVLSIKSIMNTIRQYKIQYVCPQDEEDVIINTFMI